MIQGLPPVRRGPLTVRSSVSVHMELDREIDALSDRYQLTEEAAAALRGLVELVDWQESNFIPKSNPGRGRREVRSDVASKRRVASTLLSESLAGLEVAPMRTARRVADIGSGAGFPGLVLAAALPHTHMTLVENVPEKCSFLRRTKSELGLHNVEVVEGRVQEWSGGIGACDVVTSRKMGRPNTIVQLCAPLLSSGGVIVLWQGRKDYAKKATSSRKIRKGRNAVAEALVADAADAAGLRFSQVLPMELENYRGRPVVKYLYVYEKVGEG